MADFISYELLPIVFNMSVTASVAILFVLLARLLLKKAPKIFSYALWAAVLFRLLCPVSVTAGFSLLGLFDAPAAETTAHTSVVEYIPKDVVHTPYPKVNLPVSGISEAVNEALPQGQEQTTADPLEAPVAIATMVWLAGIFAMAVYSIVSFLRLRRKLIDAVPLHDNIYLADYIDSPFVMGILRPRIYLPSALPEREQTYIIFHEQHHIRQLDHIIKALAFIALCIHWFNPLVWAAFVLSGKDMEMNCDEAVVKKLGEDIRADYSASLLSLATGRRMIAGTPLAFGEGDTKSRIRNLLNWKKPKVWLVLLAAAACVVSVFACAANPSSNEHPTEETLVEYDMPKDVSDFLISFLDTCKNDPENAVTYCYFEQPDERGAYGGADFKILNYEILDAAELSEHLYAFKLRLTKEDQDIPEQYYFVGEIDGQLYLVNSLDNVPAGLRDNMEESTQIRYSGSLDQSGTVTANDEIMQLFYSGTWQDATFFSRDAAPGTLIFDQKTVLPKLEDVFSSCQWEYAGAVEEEPAWEDLIAMYPFVFYDQGGLVRYGGPRYDCTSQDEPPMEEAVWYRAEGVFDALQEALGIYFG